MGRFLIWKKVVLVDGNNIAYRAFFALPLLNNDKGIHTNAIYGFTMMLMRILEEEKPTHMLVAFDAGKRHSVIKHIVSIKEDVKRLRLSYQSNSRLFVRCLMHSMYRVMN